ncbi:hypothetical protein KC321_g8475, partial [Hortaea werneckii]
MAEAESEQQITFNVKSSADAKYVITVPTTTTIADLKQKLSTEEYANLAPERQRLIYSGRVLKDQDTIASVKIKDGNTVHLVRGAESNNRQNPANQGGAAQTVPGAGQSPAGNVPSNIAAGTGASNPLAQLTGARYAGFHGLPGMDAFGADGGMGAPPNPDQMLRMLEDPNFAQQMNEAMNNPAVIGMLRENPMIRNNPMARAAIENPEFRRMMMNPDMIRMQMQMQRAMGGEQGGQSAFPMPGATDTTPQAGSEGQAGAGTDTQDQQPNAGTQQQPPQGNPFAALFGGAGGAPGAQQSGAEGQQQPPNPFGNLFGGGQQQGGGQQNPLQQMTQQLMQNPQMMQNMMNMMGGGGGGAGGAGAPNADGSGAAGGAGGMGGFNPWAALGGMGMGGGEAPQPQDDRPPEVRYEAQLQQLNDMGFFEFERNVQALRRSGGRTVPDLESKILQETSTLKQRDHIRTIRFIEPSATPAADREGASGENGGQGRASSSNANFSDNPLPATLYTPAAEHTTYTGDILSAKAAQKKVDLAELHAVRPKELLRPAATLPAGHTDRIARIAGVGALARIDTSGTSAPIPSINVDDTSGLSRSASKSNRRNSQVTEFYFSPIQVNSRIGFSDPIPSPQDDKDDDADDEVLTPTQARYDEQVQADKGPQHDHSMLPSPRSCRSGRPERSGPKIILTAAQVDRLVKALAESPLLTCHVKRQWWDESSDDDRSVSEGTPSLSSGSGSGSTALYSQENKAFLSEPRSPSTSQAILEEEFAQNFPDHPKAKHPAQHAAAAVRTTKFGGIALVDPKVHGTPIRFVTEGYRLGANVLQVGACTFMNIPYGTTVQSNLRVEPPSNVSGNARVMLQVVNQVLERKTGKKTYLLVAELDVTESMTKAALTELAAAAEIPLPLIQIATPTEKDRDSEIDWCALADEFEVSCQVASIVDLAAGFFPKLTAETCSMQTLTLMSELERIKTQHQDFFIL